MADGEPRKFVSGDEIPGDRGKRYYRWTDPDTGEVGGHECLHPGGRFGERRGKQVRWTDVGSCPHAPQRTPGAE
ncbi:hypothetical protein ABZ816_29795 [Actinosynnema sp. NPDC047251]|uniref:Uncharacterized protein n=1 Tax=Saccharothrix espanaensis (strain ATCC 51144 / DSM 44229 / JCM 9112 / NBRC 15066 / NRRL 15764) TaxID=1179773 RepID=K0KB22_SACES|nr:hypothetical protein [Saccharothrix espanaensis]CCH34727.1 hypothetical protein BN6_75010 [Saccharothrix espanaensis DSM 44229]